ncbi:hypothetical protein PC116_g18307 [Phytophthora cactorum]|uniref:TRAF-type domain-containing protein n=1 Tax=Phytophthora cactorum TaxID=29920 RepID=A0A329SVD9_9STRA|nr:hypothetical protein PC112_g14172 [Phytophthora cactorum]KAG2816341.1 hypothetical protein PC111_g13186 [Phytophthora cactorum]KAG2853073.1 hypothetical protein PC113_g14489 [Phytophthora cactorum]KAG2895708.1 hypothetical protein PC114_g15397 [Phytophthora cactorum]KAG2908303.1 hypothetical protein PC115_g13625 [Phytophthora cactorum]
MSKRRLPSQLRHDGDDDRFHKPPSKALLPSHKLQCFSVACLDMPRLEFGDKIVLPPKILLGLQYMKIAPPLLFMVQAVGLDIQPEGILNACSRHYCSVQEFSAPDGQVFLPYWLMQNLGVAEGGTVEVTSVVNLPRGVYCRLQPEAMSFLDLAAEIGPKLLMETALRRYSVLSVGSTILIEYGSVQYYLRVVELKPASVVSLCGDVDLETYFMPPEGSDPKRKSTASNENTSEQFPSPVMVETTNNDPTSVVGYGRRLRDGGYVESALAGTADTSSNEKAQRKLPLSSLQKAQQIIRDKQSKIVSTEAVADVAAATDSSVLAVQLRSAQRAFSTPGYTIGTAAITLNNDALSSNLAVDQAVLPDPSVHKCNLCLADVSSINMELHTLRCAKNPAYHKFECSVCHEKILCIHENQHRHCPECTVLCGSNETLGEHQRDEHTATCKCTLCHVFFTRAELQDHVDNRQCEHALMPCSLCGLAFKKKEIAQHTHMCSSRTERCDQCKTYIKITELDMHQQQCGAFATRQEPASLRPETLLTKASNQHAVECAYCLQGDFPNIAAVEYHVLHDCRIAKSFTTESATTNQEEADQHEPASSEDAEEPQSEEIARPLLAQGRMRRKGDTNALRSTPPSRLRFGNISTNNNRVDHHFSNRRTPPPSPTVLPPARLELQAEKPRKSKLKSRQNPQLRSLPQPKLVATPEGRVSISDRTVSSGPADLCISSAGGTSYRALAAPHRSQVRTRTRRRPAANLPPPGRLDKLP